MPDESIWRGNIGEWGEAFTLLHLLAHNVLYNADSHGQKISTEYGVVEAIYRTETSGLQIELLVTKDAIIVKHNNEYVTSISKAIFAEVAHSLFTKMQTQASTASHPEQSFLREIGCESLKASSLMKADLTARIYDGFLSSCVNKNFSIKTVVGGAPSLANASGQSYIDYELHDFTEEMANEIMGIDGRAWAVERTKKIIQYCPDPKPIVRSRIFDRNLQKCYFCAPEVVGLAVLYGQTYKGKSTIDSIAALKQHNPLKYTENDMEDYEIAVRNYLWGVVFDLNPGTPWHGPTPVDGYLLVTDDEEVLSYQTSRRHFFENYLLMHSNWDTPSTKRNPDIGRVWRKEDGTWMYSLSCVIRYNVREYKGDNAHLAGIDL